MATCAACEAEMDVDEFDVDRGDLLSCPQCGANLEVVGLGPVEFDVAVEEDVDARETDRGSAAPGDGGDGFD